MGFVLKGYGMRMEINAEDGFELSLPARIDVPLGS
jgi:hypothetical protein